MFSPLPGRPESNNARDYFARSGTYLAMPFADIGKVILAPDATEGVAATLFSRDIDREHVARIAGSIKANGFLKDKWPTFYFERGRLTVAKGNHRTAALQLLLEEGWEGLEEVLFTTEDRRKTEEDAIAEVWLDNDGLGLSMEKKAECVYRLHRLNANIKRIAEKLSISESYASKLLDYHTMPEELKAIAKSGDMAGTEVLKTYQRHERDATETKAVIVAAVEEAKAKGKEKATGKHIKAVEDRVAPKRQKAFEVKPAVLSRPGEPDSPLVVLACAAVEASRRLKEMPENRFLGERLAEYIDQCITAGLLPKSVKE